jgi:transposase
MGATVTMSAEELDRVRVLGLVLERRLTQRAAAQRLGLSSRQVRRLLRSLRRGGASELGSRRRGRPSNRRLPEAVRAAVLELIRTRYSDFGPTLAHEKLLEQHAAAVSVETVRKWMMAEGLWVARKERDPRVHSPRLRRACRGELIQIDGCDHEWFEERAPRCVLLVFVDDATSQLMELRFAQSESTFEYFTSVQRYLARHGRPVAFYSDKATVFRVNRKDHGGDGLTQFGRAMQELNVDILCANSAPAKGRVERAHLTLQDRLVKELRLAGVSGIEDGNRFLEGFMADYNRRFARAPRSPHDAHRPLLQDSPLRDILCLQEERKVSHSLTFHYNRVMYVLEDSEIARAVRGQRVRILEAEDGAVSIRHGDHELAARAFPKHGGAGVTQADIVADKLLGSTLALIREQQQLREAERLQAARTRRERALLQAANR